MGERDFGMELQNCAYWNRNDTESTDFDSRHRLPSTIEEYEDLLPGQTTEVSYDDLLPSNRRLQQYAALPRNDPELQEDSNLENRRLREVADLFPNDARLHQHSSRANNPEGRQDSYVVVRRDSSPESERPRRGNFCPDDLWSWWCIDRCTMFFGSILFTILGLAGAIFSLFYFERPVGWVLMSVSAMFTGLVLIKKTLQRWCCP